jgi:hypothetical protein
VAGFSRSCEVSRSEYFAGLLKASFSYSITRNVTCIGYFGTGNPMFNLHESEMLFQDGNLKNKQILLQTQVQSCWFSSLQLKAPILQLIKLFLIIPSYKYFV